VLIFAVKNIFIVCAVVVGKCVPEGTSEASHNHIAIELEIKLKMTHKYKVGQSLSVIARELGFAKTVRKVEQPSTSHETDVEVFTSHEITVPHSSDIADSASHKSNIDEILQVIALSPSSYN
jgi:uncharacterized protein YabE (DUF348 family)